MAQQLRTLRPEELTFRTNKQGQHVLTVKAAGTISEEQVRADRAAEYAAADRGDDLPRWCR